LQSLNQQNHDNIQQEAGMRTMKDHLPSPSPKPSPPQGGEGLGEGDGKPDAVESEQMFAPSNKFAASALAAEGQFFGRALEDLYFWKHPSLQK